MSSKQWLVVSCALALVGALLVAVWPRGARRASVHRSEPELSKDARPVPTSSPRRARRALPRRPAAHTQTASAVVSPAPPAAAAAPPSAPAAVANPSGRAQQLSTAVLQQAVRGDWVTVDEHDTPCPPHAIRIVYDAPSALGGYEKGAYFEPLGPSPSDQSDEVNGLLLCEGSTFLYRGFEAYYRADRGQWDVYPFPIIE